MVLKFYSKLSHCTVNRNCRLYTGLIRSRTNDHFFTSLRFGSICGHVICVFDLGNSFDEFFPPQLANSIQLFTHSFKQRTSCSRDFNALLTKLCCFSKAVDSNQRKILSICHRIYLHQRSVCQFTRLCYFRTCKICFFSKQRVWYLYQHFILNTWCSKLGCALQMFTKNLRYLHATSK